VYAKALLKLDDSSFDEYMDTWDKIQAKSASISSSFYQDDLISVDSEFSSKISAATAEVSRLQAAVESAEAAAKAASEAAESAASAAQTAVTTTATAATTAATAATTTTSEAATTISAETTTAMTNVDTTVTNGLTSIKTKVLATLGAIVLGVRASMSLVYASVLSVCNKIGEHMSGLYDSAYGWGVDMMQGLIDGIRSQMDDLADVAEEAADTISSYLHFSSPDVGPLADYESWMPDFIGGLVKGIERSRGMIQKAASGLAADMVVSPKLAMADGPNPKTANNTMTHTGTIRVEGVTDDGQITDVVEIVIDRLRREVRI